MDTIFRRALIVFAILLALPVAAAACRCVPGIAVDRQYDNAQVVGIFKFHSVDVKYDEKGKGQTIVNFIAEKVYKGEVKPGQTIAVPEWGNTACAYYFGNSSVGEEFLFFPYPGRTSSGDLWTVHGCTGSKPLKDAAADMLYLDNTATVRAKTRLYGTIVTYWKKQARTEPLADLPVTVRGNGKTYHLRTDQNGVYEIYGLPPGEYRVTPAAIDEWNAEFNERFGSSPAIVKAKAGTVRDFRYYPEKLKIVPTARQ